MKFLTTDNSSTVSVGCYRIDAERRMRIEDYQVKVGQGDLRSIVSAMSSDPCWSPDHHELVDFSEAEYRPFSDFSKPPGSGSMVGTAH